MKIPKISFKFLVIVITAGLVAIPALASAIEYRGIGGQPANPRADNPRSKSIFIYNLKPGESVNDGVIVRNGTEQSHNIMVYPTDSLVSSGGAFACEQKAEQANDVGSWIKMDKTEVTLPAQASETINFTLTVPKDADVGEHNGCIAIQSGSQNLEKDVNGLTLSFRSAIRVAVTVPGKISKTLDIVELKLQKAAADDKQGVQVGFRNRGNVSLDTDVTVQMTGPFGRKIDKIDGTYSMLSGVTTELNFELKRPKIPWFYTVTAIGRYNDDPSAALGQNIEKNKVVARSTTVIIWPSLKQLAIVLLIMAVIVALMLKFVYKRYLLKKKQRSARSYVVKKGESIEGIAKKVGASWYDIALLNNLKAPYKVRSGKRIYVPTKAKARAKKVKKPRTKKAPSSNQKIKK